MASSLTTGELDGLYKNFHHAKSPRDFAPLTRSIFTGAVYAAPAFSFGAASVIIRFTAGFFLKLFQENVLKNVETMEELSKVKSFEKIIHIGLGVLACALLYKGDIGMWIAMSIAIPSLVHLLFNKISDSSKLVRGTEKHLFHYLA